MKKLLVMVTALLFSVGAFAQHEVGTFTLQPKIGLNIASLTDTEDSDPRIGFVGGVEGEYQFTDMLSLSAGLLYSAQGCKAEDEDLTIKTDYINIPILVNCYVVKGLAVKLGIQPGFNINSKAKVKEGGVTVEMDMDDLGCPSKTFDFSIPVGVSYEYSNVQVDARYNWGLTKIADNLDCKNSVFQITVGYKFAL